MDWHKMDYLRFWAMRMRNTIYFAPLVTTSNRKKSNKSSTRGLSLKNEQQQEHVRNC